MVGSTKVVVHSGVGRGVGEGAGCGSPVMGEMEWRRRVEMR